MILPSLPFTKLLLLLIALPLTLLTAVAVPLTRAQETPSEIRLDEEGTRLLFQGMDQFEFNQRQAGLQSLQAALEHFRQEGDRPGEAEALFILGSSYKAMGQHQQAIEYYQQAVPLFRETGNPHREMMTLLMIAEVLIAQNQTDLAMDYFRQSVEEYGALRAEQIARDVYIASDFGLIKECYHRYVELLRQQNRPQEAQQVLDLIRDVESR